MSDPHWRLILDEAAPGAWNMAVDEALLDYVAAATAPPTLRFYGWRPPCLSLGYFQRFEDVDTGACRAMGIDVVRRPTGGRAVLHEAELTYSIMLPVSVLGQDAGILPSYYRISRALQAALAALGIGTSLAPGSAAPSVHQQGPLCFDGPSAHEILLKGRKLVGSAQMRRADAILQHGSILIESRPERLAACFRTRDDASGRLRRLDSSAIGLAEVGFNDRAQLAHAIAEAIEEEFEMAYLAGRLSASEVQAALGLHRSKYASAAWTERRLQQLAAKTTRTR
jgi:lipoate-protein ligase A